MIFDLGAAKIRTTLLDFNSYVLEERHSSPRADILLMSFNTFDEINLLKELDGDSSSRLSRLAQLSADDNCSVFCGIKTLTEGMKTLSVAVAHKGVLCDIADRTDSSENNGYLCSDKLKIYNTMYGRIAVLIDTDGTHGYLWNKIHAADFVFCFTLNDSIGCEITKLAVKNNCPTLIASSSSSVLIRN